MDFDPEKFLKDIKSTCDKQCNSSSNPSGSCFRFCFAKCPLLCKSIYVEGPLFLPRVVLSPPPLPPLQPPRTRVFVPNPLNEVAKVTQKHLLTSSLIIMACLIGATILVCILASIMKFRRRYNSRSSRSLRPIFFGTQEDFLDEDQGPEIDHHIWYIQTIGLPQSVIDSISVFKFDKHEGLIDGTECSVCLNEFQDDENLRLLPKCSHAFHISCIDTWLRSHKNCPLCRAPIVSSDFNVHVELSVPDSSDLSSNQESEMTDLDSPSGGMIVVSERIRHDGSSGLRNGDDHDHTNCGLPTEDETGDENEKRASDLSISRDRSRVRSDLVESRVIAETEMQPMRRSASLDSASAMVIYNAVANAFPSKSQRDSVMQQVKNSKSKHVSKRISTGSMSFRKLIKSSSIGHALQKAPISMKRSSSSNSRHSRIQDSILPI